MNQIIQNEVKCLKCDDIIFSRHTHDFVTCSCGNVSVDGGLSYLKRSWETRKFEERSLSTDRETLNDVINFIDDSLKRGAPIDCAGEIVYYHYGVDGFDSVEIWNKIIESAQEAKDTNRNAAGIVFAVIRAMRDNGVLDMEKFNGNE